MYKRSDKTEDYALNGNVITDVEIFRTGYFRDMYFDKEYLEGMVTNYNKMRDNEVFVNVPIRVDHSWSVASVAGYILDLRVVSKGKMSVKRLKAGSKEKENVEIDDYRLVADFEITEPEVLEKIKRKTYRDRSVEIGSFVDNDGEKYAPALMGVAFVDIPQVDKLAAMFSYDKMSADEVDVADVEEKDMKEVVGEKVEDVEAKETEIDTKDVVDGEIEKVEDGGEPVEEKEDVDEKEKEDEVDKVDGDIVDGETPEEPEKMDKEIEVDEYKKQVEEMRAELKKRDMAKRFEMIDSMVAGGSSTPAMASLEKQLIASFFANEGEEGYLNSEGKLELFYKIKSSTPSVWEKKDEIVNEGNPQDIDKPEDVVDPNGNGVNDETIEDAKKALLEAGLPVKE